MECSFICYAIDVQHLFICLFAICISSLVRSFAHFVIGLSVFLLSFKSFGYILDNGRLSDMSFANILIFYQIRLLQIFQSVASVFILLTVSFTEQKLLILTKCSLQ